MFGLLNRRRVPLDDSRVDDVLLIGVVSLLCLCPPQTSFKDDVSNEEWLLIKALKPVSYSLTPFPLISPLSGAEC